MFQQGGLFDGGHHAFEFTQPELLAEAEPWRHHLRTIQLPRPSAGVGHQRQQAIQHQKPIPPAVLVPKPELT